MPVLHQNRDRGTISGTALVAVLVFVAGMLSACAGGGNYGRLMGAKGIYDQMRSGPIGADYQYYKAPSTAVPNAIIAIHKNYTLKTTAWSAINLAGGQSQSWRVYSGSMGLTPKLLEIQGPTGEHIGLWYSVWTSSVVKMLGGNEVQVYPPSTDTGPGRRNRD